jgi:hypothetical protein
MTKWFATLTLVILGWQPARAQETLFDPDSNHPWNRLHAFLWLRKADDGFVRDREELEPPIQALSKFLLAGPSHERALAFLDDFLNRRADKLIDSPIKRALLQRDLWAVFGMTSGTGILRPWQIRGQVVATGIEDTGDEHFGNKQARRALQKRLAAVMRRLALSPQEVTALPDNLREAVNSGAYPQLHDPRRPDRTFLPADLQQRDGPWVLVGNTERFDGLAAPAHVQFTNGRSLFLVYLRLPGGRQATQEYLAKIGEGKAEQFPEGTQTALLRRMLLVDNHGELAVAPVTEEVQLRVFRHLNVVDSYELLLDRSELLAQRRGGLRAVGADETSYFDISGFHGGSPTGTRDLLEAKPRPSPHAVMDCCVNCHRFHGDGGIQSVASAFAGGSKHPDLQPARLERQIESALNWTKKTYSWGLLQGMWEVRD